jgi:hypothetical protein
MKGKVKITAWWTHEGKRLEQRGGQVKRKDYYSVVDT